MYKQRLIVKVATYTSIEWILFPMNSSSTNIILSLALTRIDNGNVYNMKHIEIIWCIKYRNDTDRTIELNTMVGNNSLLLVANNHSFCLVMT